MDVRPWYRNVWLHRVLVLIGVVMAPLAMLAKQAVWTPQSPFLAPSSPAHWVLHPEQQYFAGERTNEKLLEPVRFRRSFTISDIPRQFTLRAKALTSMTVAVNGHTLTPNTPVDHWKHPSRYDLTPALRKGANHIEILVSHDQGVSALLVESPAQLATHNQWRASIGPGFADDQGVAGPVDRPGMPSALQTQTQPRGLWTVVKWLAVAWLAGHAGIGLWLIIAACRRAGEDRGEIRCSLSEGSGIPRWAQAAVPAVILGVSLVINLTNTQGYDFRQGPDAEGHLDHIQQVARTWTPRLASDGWQTYHPPLYYFAAAAAYRLAGGDPTDAHMILNIRDEDTPYHVSDLAGSEQRGIKAAQYLGGLVGSMLALVAWLYARRFFPDDPLSQWLVMAFTAFLPLGLTTNLLLNNQAFSATVQAGAFLLVLAWAAREELSWRHAAVLGAVVGLGLLLRFTGVIVFAVGLLGLGMRALQLGRRRDWLLLIPYGLTCFAVCGWFYLRNIHYFGNPFIGNWQAHPIVQYPSYRSLGYFLEFGSVFFHHPNRAMYTSWPNGTYASFWADGTMTFFSWWMTLASFIQSLMLFLAVPASVAILIGLVRTWVGALRRPALNTDLLLMAAPWWTWSALWSFCLKIPAVGGGSPRYFMYLVPVLGIYLVRGRQWLHERLPWARWVLDGTFICLCVLAIVIYRYSGFRA